MMKTRLSLFIMILSAGLFANNATIVIDAKQAGPNINPEMYGIFLEEINHGVDGGLYAELVRNRAFEDSRPPEGYKLQGNQYRDEQGARAGFDRFHYSDQEIPFWSLIQNGDAKGSMNLEKTGGISEASCYCLRLDVDKADNGYVGIANEGFFGIGITENSVYNLSLYAKGSGPITVFLQNSDGKVCSNKLEISNINSHWKKYSGILKASQTEANSRLIISVGSKGSFWFDFVSLFPEKTWHGSSNGLRPDLAQKIADLKPGFVRFPGGCVVEGGTIESAYNWKDTVGPLEERSECFGPWMYRRTHGMGLYEYLKFCEDIGAEPLWVGFAGQTCIFRGMEHVAMDEMGWVRDGFLDIIEYANGAVDSEWGSMRAAAGHENPFDLKYIEIGNENQGEEYGKRYRYIYDTLKAKYPDMKYLADLSWTSVQSLGNAQWDIEDRHYYQSPRWFATGFNRYDGRDRSLPPLYLGEVAVTSGNSTPLRGNLLAALSEGIFLMGCERNADTVSMVSYAPLLGHVRGRTELVDAPPPWHAMIYFDNNSSFGTVSYYLWKLFGNYVPSYTLKTDVLLPEDNEPVVAGAVGVGTWGTSAEFKDIKVVKDCKVLYSTDFSNGADDWKVESGQWRVENGVYRQARRQNAISYVGDPSWTNYTLTLKARKLSGNEGFLITFGQKGRSKFWWNLGGWGNSQHAIEFNQNLVGSGVRGSIATNQWYDIKIDIKNDVIKCYLDGKLIHEASAAKEQTFFATTGYDEKSGDYIIKAINYADKPFEGQFKLDGLGISSSKAELIVLSADDVTVNNSLREPEKVVPVKSDIDIDSNGFSHVFPAYSLSVIRLEK